jgi:ATP-dependent Lon protease
MAAEKVVRQNDLSNLDKDHIPLLLEPIDLSVNSLQTCLGSERFYPELAERIMKPGIATGLAWTPHGGEILFIEATAIENGKGQLILTGQLGEIMKESAQIALSLVRSILTTSLGLKFDFNTYDIHIHVPAGAIPKDGPSAGITILAALASLILGKPLDSSLGMTGEVTLRGVILPIGGLKEKILAAHRVGLTQVLFPKKNQPDLASVPQEVKSQLQFIFVETVEDVLGPILGKSPFPWLPSAAA